MPSQPIPVSDSITSNISDLNDASMFTDRSSPEDGSFSSSLQGVRSFMDTHALQLRGDCHHIQRLRHNNMINYLRLREQNAVLSVLRKAIVSKLQSLKAQRAQHDSSRHHYQHDPGLSDSSLPTSSATSLNISTSPATSPGSSPTSTVTDDQFTASFSRFSSIRSPNATARHSTATASSQKSRGSRLVRSATSHFLKPRTSFEPSSRMQCFNFGGRISRSSDDGATAPSSSNSSDRPVHSTRHLLELYIEAIDNVQSSFNKVRWAKLRDDVIRKSTLPVVTSRLDHATPGKGIVAFSDRLLHAARLDDMIQRCMAKQEYLLNEAEDKLTSSVLGVRLYKNRGSH